MRANDLKERVKKKGKYNSCYQNNKKGPKCSYDEEYTCMVRCHCDEGKAFLKPIFIFQKYKFRVTFINSSRLYKYTHHHHTVIKKKKSLEYPFTFWWRVFFDDSVLNLLAKLQVANCEKGSKCIISNT